MLLQRTQMAQTSQVVAQLGTTAALLAQAVTMEGCTLSAGTGQPMMDVVLLPRDLTQNLIAMRAAL